MDVRAMNICLLSKWIDRLERDDKGLCCSLPRNILVREVFFRFKTDMGLSSGGPC
jgi:hypothetical protein